MIGAVYDSATQWERFGRDDPYYGVLSTEEFRAHRLDEETRQRFFATGREHIDAIFDEISQTVASDFTPKDALDYGCGVGRLLVPLAERGLEVTGVDVSPSMLAEAARNLAAHDVSSVRLIEPPALENLTHQFDLVHTVAVLQHIPVRQGQQIFRTLVSLIRPGGVGVINVPIGASPVARTYSWTMAHVPFAYKALNLVQRRPWDTPFMEMNVYRLNPLADVLADRGVTRLSLQLFTGPPGRFRYRAAHLLFRIPG